MKKPEEKLYDAITEIDDDLITEAEGKTSFTRKNALKSYLAFAACFVIFVALCVPLSSVFSKLADTKENVAGVSEAKKDTDSKNAFSDSNRSYNSSLDNSGTESANEASKNDEARDDNQINESHSTDTPKQNPYFNATVLKVYKGTVLVKCDADTTPEKMIIKGEIEVNLDVVSTTPLPPLKEGDSIRIVYAGMIEETMPLKIPTVFAIYALTEDGEVVYPTEENARN